MSFSVFVVFRTLSVPPFVLKKPSTRLWDGNDILRVLMRHTARASMLDSILIPYFI